MLKSLQNSCIAASLWIIKWVTNQMFKLLSISTTCLLLFLTFVPITLGAQSQTSGATFYQVRSIEIGKLGIANPSGLTFSPDANKFIVADLQRDSQFGTSQPVSRPSRCLKRS